MTATRPPIPTAPHAEYRRRARRIRSAFAAAPVTRLRALRELADHHDRTRGDAPATTTPPVMTPPQGAAGRFARLVRERMDGPVLRYSHRTRLLRSAEQHGIGRFEANLIIAAVQHEAGAARPARPVATSSPAWMPTALAFAATQSLIAIAAWWAIG